MILCVGVAIRCVYREGKKGRKRQRESQRNCHWICLNCEPHEDKKYIIHYYSANEHTSIYTQVQWTLLTKRKMEVKLYLPH